MTFRTPLLAALFLPLLLACQKPQAGPEVKAQPMVQAPAETPGTQAMYWGIFEEGLYLDHARIEALQTKLGSKPAMIMWYSDWFTEFPTQACELLSQKGYMPHIVWEAWKMGDRKTLTLAEILEGKWDAYLQRFGADAGRYGKPVMIRWGHEFNGDWYPWAGATNGNSPATYVKAYRYVYDKVVAAGGKNLIWMWSPNNGPAPVEPWNRIEDYYPGDAYVDWVAMDGYNWGTSQNWSKWISFTEVFSECLASVQKVAPNKPLMIGETASSSTGGDKAAWIRSYFNEVKAMPGLKGWIWFNINKETDWRFDADPASLEAVKTGLKDPVYGHPATRLETLHKAP